MTAEQQILQELAPPLRLAVLSALNRHILERIDFFQGLDPAFLSSVCRVLEPSFAAPQDMIFKEAEPALHVYVVQHGVVQLLCYRGRSLQPTHLDYVVDGAYFGEIGVLQREDASAPVSVRTFSAQSLTFCSMFSLSKLDLFDLLPHYPEAAAKLHAFADEHHEHLENVKRRCRAVSLPPTSHPPLTRPRPPTHPPSVVSRIR